MIRIVRTFFLMFELLLILLLFYLLKRILVINLMSLLTGLKFIMVSMQKILLNRRKKDLHRKMNIVKSI